MANISKADYMITDIKYSWVYQSKKPLIAKMRRYN